MHYVGIDLAWGQRRPTGIAVLDTEARLLHVDLVRTDDDIEAGLAAYVGDACVVGIDAPLVVTNPTGSRPAEKALTRDFRGFDAGTHPSNTGKAEFADGPRGGHLAKRLGLDLTPRSRRPRRALEVYPHAASVVLFGLPRVLKYKQKRGRDLPLLRSELLALMDHLEGLVTTSERWAEMRAAVETAARKSELKRVEDQVDAVLCAYVALFVDNRPDDVTWYGDRETGCIVTPTLGIAPPHAARSDAGAAPLLDGEDVAAAAVRTYAAAHDELVDAGEAAVALVSSILDEAGINYLSVTGRTKSVPSFAEKATRTRGGLRLYDDPLSQITDQLGVRVITYVRDDVDVVADLLGEQVIVRDDRDLGEETAAEGRFGYASRHLLVYLDPAREGHSDYAVLGGRVVQVQVRTVLQHAWAEFEHDVRYKGSVPPAHAHELDRRFTLAAGLLELADREFALINDTLRGMAPDLRTTGELAHLTDADGRLEARELAAYLAARYPGASRSRAEHYRWLSGLLRELGVRDVDALAALLAPADEDAIATRMSYRHPPGAVRRLDDALLWVRGRDYVGLAGNAHRVEALTTRLEQLRG